MTSCEKDWVNHMDFIIIGPILGMLTFSGLVGNVLSALVLLRRKMRSPFSIMLASLAFWDSVFLFNCLIYKPMDVTIQYFCFDYDPYPIFTSYYWFLFYFQAPVYYTAQAASAYITISVNLERFIAVCHPMKARKWCTARRAILAVAIASFMSIIFNIPRSIRNAAYYYYVKNVTVTIDLDTDMNSTGIVGMLKVPKYIVTEDKFSSSLYWVYYSVWFTMLGYYVIPFVTMFAFNTAIVRALQKASLIRRSMREGDDGAAAAARQSKKSLSYTKILLRASAVYLVCTTMEILFLLSLLLGLRDQYYSYIFGLSWLTSCSNPAVNPLIYCASGRLFRSELKKMLGLNCFKSRSAGNASQSQSSILSRTSIQTSTTTV